MVKALATTNRAPSKNGAALAVPPAAAPVSAPLFTADSLQMQRRMRVNPLPRLNPEMLGITLDQFEYGHLREAVQLWESMCRRDDTLVTVKPQLENEVASQDWGVFVLKRETNNPEALRHQACLDYFYEHVRVTDAYDRNVRGGRDKLIEFLMFADSFYYEALHIVWKPKPGKTVPVEGAQPAPVICAEIEHVPLWFFENTTGRLRFLKDGGFGADGRPLEEFGDWIVASGRGLMFAAAICYTFKRLSFQDWTVFNERYAQNKPVGTTPASKDSPQGQAMAALVEAFNADMGMVFYEFTGEPDKPPISLLGPDGTAAVGIWEKFIERQDRKISSMYRGNDLSMMSRAGKGEKPTGASLQGDEGDAMKLGACRRVAGFLQEDVDRRVIEICFGAGVEPLAYFGLPGIDKEDKKDVRESAGFLADRGARVVIADTAERLGIQLAPAGTPEEDLLQPATPPQLNPSDPNSQFANRNSQMERQTANALARDLDRFLGPLVPEFKKAFADDLIPLRLSLEHVLKANGDNFTANAAALQSQLPWILRQILATNLRTPSVLAEIMQKAFEKGAKETRS